MTANRRARGEPAQPVQQAPREPRLRPSEERLLGAIRTNRRLALLAVVLAAVAAGVVTWRALAPSGTDCQTTAWNVAPAAENLPAGWTISATQYDIDRKQMTLLGPAPQDQTSSQPAVYVTITCYPQGAADSVTRSQSAATAAGQTVTARTDLGEQGYTALTTAGSTFVQFRHGSVVVYLAASSTVTGDEVNGVAGAFDIAMGGNGAETPIGTLDAGSPGPSAPPSEVPSAGASPSASAAAPELESALPTQVGSVNLSVESALGATILGSDQGSRAIIAALRADGKSPEDLRVAQAYDPTGASDLTITAIRVQGMTLDTLKSLVLSSWLAASGAGVKEDSVTLGGHTFTRIDYGDEGPLNYVLAENDMIRIIETADPGLAAQAAAALP